MLCTKRMGILADGLSPIKTAGTSAINIPEIGAGNNQRRGVMRRMAGGDLGFIAHSAKEGDERGAKHA